MNPVEWKKSEKPRLVEILEKVKEILELRLVVSLETIERTKRMKEKFNG